MYEHIVIYNSNITGKTKAYSLKAIDSADAAQRFAKRYPGYDMRYVFAVPAERQHYPVYVVRPPTEITVEPTENI